MREGTAESTATNLGTKIAVVAVAVCLGLLAFIASPAQADLETVGHFAGSAELTSPPFPEEVQLGGVGGMAVNYTGNGGMTAGTVYAATRGPSGGSIRVAVFTPKTNPLTLETELEFTLGWEVLESEVPVPRCGPAVGGACPNRVEASAGKVDVDIDQATGNVYVFNGTFSPGTKGIIEYTPTGTAVLARFGEIAPFGKTTLETPGQVHESTVPGAIAVNEAGDVYIFDVNSVDGYHRLMRFRPKTPGIFTEYEYAGMGEDIGAGFKNQGRRPWEPVMDEAGNIYVAPDQSHVEMYDSSNPGSPPVCDFEFAVGGITGITVNPKTGTPFFFSYKQPKRLYQLGLCDPGTGKFKGGIIGETIVSPERDDLWGLAYDPIRKFEPTRTAGVLYGGAANPVPNSGVGEGQPGQTSLGYIFAPAEELPPVVESEAVQRVTEGNARVTATINPEGSKTKYVFQYLTEAAYQQGLESFSGAAEAPLEGGFLSNSSGVQAVAVTLTGLQPDTVYRYRVVAISNCAPGEPEKVCEDSGAAESFHTYPAEVPGLHDVRVYELVSPAQKNSGQVLPAEPGVGSCGLEAECKPGSTYDHFPMQSAPNGEAVVFEGTSFALGTGVSQGNEYISRRDPTLGWQTVNLTPPMMQKEGRGFKGVSESLTTALFGQVGPALNPAAPPEYKNLYTESTSSPFALTPLLTAAPSRPATSTGHFEAIYAAATADFSRIFFEANDVLTEAVPGVAPKPESGGAEEFNLYEWEAATGQLRLVNVLPGNATTKVGASMGVVSANGVSADGSRVFWSNEAGKVFVREDAALTKEIPDPGKFLSASTDGSEVLLTNGHLYDLETATTTDLTNGKSGFQGIAGQSDDLSQIYFIDTAILTAEEKNSEGAKAQAGKPNLYAWNGNSEVPTTNYVATLLPEDNSGANIVRSQAWSALPSKRSAEASPNGRFLTFLSLANLTGYDNTGPCEGNHAGGSLPAPCPEVFFYDAETRQLECPSCNRDGVRPLGLSVLRLINNAEVMPQPRYMLDSGRLYFDSQNALNQFDTNDGVEDVYEFEPEGTGGCTREGGCVTLISSGHEAFDANFLAADASAANVFFTTRNRLLPVDTDEMIDLYDARENGGFAFESQLPQGSCQGEGCQLPAPAPAPPPPASQSPGGEGDNVKPPCKKGQVRKNGKCVKKKHKPKNNKKGGKSKRGGSK
jgi:hypothetical protein